MNDDDRNKRHPHPPRWYANLLRALEKVGISPEEADHFRPAFLQGFMLLADKYNTSQAAVSAVFLAVLEGTRLDGDRNASMQALRHAADEHGIPSDDMADLSLEIQDVIWGGRLKRPQ